MRVTNQMVFEASRQQIAASREQVFNASQQVTTGERVVHPGDDPGAAGAIIAHSLSVQRFDTIGKAVSAASDEAQLADGALQSASELMTRAQQLAVQMGNDSYSASDRAGAAQEIRDISGQVATLMNTQEAGRYIFGGSVDRTPPFDSAGNYSGDASVRQVEVAPGLLQNASIRADVALKGVGGGVDVFASLASLAASLSANDGVGVRASVATMSSSVDQISTALTQNGGILDGFQSAMSIGTSSKDAASKLLSAVQEADIFDATSNLTKAQQGLEASLLVASKTFNLSLMDYLK